MSGKAKDLRNRRFGSLKVIKRVENSSDNQPQWLCECECGNTHVAQGRYLKSGKVKSCGCMKRGAQPGEMSEREMWYSSDSLSRLQLDSDTYSLEQGADPYQNLANAIVCVAADDYREALKTGNTGLVNSLTEFFNSDWYKTLTKVKPEKLLSLLNKENAGNLSAVYI